MILVGLLAAPWIAAIVCFFTKSRWILSTVNIVGALVTLSLTLVLVKIVPEYNSLQYFHGILYVDALSTLVILIVSLIGFVCSLYSAGYLNKEFKEGAFDARKIRKYYIELNMFIFTMLLFGVSNNLGILWIAIEATTLFSTLLVGIENKKTSLEAAWKYIIICTVGITFALFGTVLTYYSSVSVLGESSDALNWSSLVKVADKLDPKLIKLAFLFILIGYGTKAGLAPMHTWLPDAHSQAPSPVSALLSGVLLNCAIYGILRFHIIVCRCVGVDFSSQLLLIFGLLSIGIATPFILLQHDFKRLLAYSSLEHIGIITTGLGIGGWLGVYGSMLHTFNHAVTKSLMFFIAGNLLLNYKTREIEDIRGVVRAMPFTGVLLVLGSFAIAGSPPFSVFISEFTILSAGFKNGNIISSILLLFFISCIFAGLIYYMIKMAFGNAVEANGRSPLHGEPSRFSIAAMSILTLYVVTLGFYIPPPLNNLIEKIAEIVSGT